MIQFKNLWVGQSFIFWSEKSIHYQGARGPWVKTGPRTYQRVDGDLTLRFHVGTIKVAVEAVK